MPTSFTRFLLLLSGWLLTAATLSGQPRNAQSLRPTLLSKRSLPAAPQGKLRFGTSLAAARMAGVVSQQWVARYSSSNSALNEAVDVAVDGTGNVYVTGSSFSLGGRFMPGNYDYATVKYNPDGQQLWSVRYNGPANGQDQATDLAVDAAGNVYVTGYSAGSGSGNDYATVKYSSTGQELWVARYNGPINTNDFAQSVVLDGAGNVYVTGYSMAGGNGSQDYATVKYSSSGQQQWVATYNGASRNDVPVDLAVDAAGNAYVTGYSESSSGTVDYATIRYSPAGQQQWVARYNGMADLNDLASAIALDAAGNVYVTGYSTTLVNSGTSQDYATVKYSANGRQEWVATYNGPGNSNDQAADIGVDGLGNVVVTGFSGGLSGPEYATLKYSPGGQQLWAARYGGPDSAFNGARELVLDATGNVYVTGTSTSSTGTDYATVKYTSSGELEWEARYDEPGSSREVAWGIALDASGQVYVTGRSTLNGTTTDYLTVKYSQPSAAPLSLTTAVTNTGCGPGGAINLTVSGGVAPYRYRWSGPNGFEASSEDISGLVAGAYSVTVTDAAQNTASLAVTVETSTEDRTPPVILASGFQTGFDKDGTRTIYAEDVDYGSTDDCSGIASMIISPRTFTCANVGPNQVTLTVTDNAGNSASETVTVTLVDNLAPIILASGFQTALDRDGTRTIYAEDVDYGSFDQCGSIASMTITPRTFTCANVGPNRVTITVMDNAGNSASETVTVDITATAACSTAVARASKAAPHAGPASARNQLEAYPNPAAEQATIRFQALRTGPAQVQVYNSLGRVVVTLYEGVAEQGQLYERQLNSLLLPAGLYTCRFVQQGQTVTERLVISKY